MDLAAFRALEPLCWRAPSAHNTQPWRLRYERWAITVGWDPADTLPAGDPTGRDLRLSLGAFVETCLIVAADAGLRLDWAADHD
ncbi:nitroreductase, partial [Micromonospora chalcea]